MAAPKTSPVVWEGWFSFEVPEEWDFEEHDGLISVHGETHSTHISCFARSSKDAPSPDEVRTMALNFAREEGFEDVAVTTGTLDGSPSAQFEADDREKPPNHWHVYTVVDETRAILMTSVMLKSDAGKERAERERMIASFQWDDPLDEGGS